MFQREFLLITSISASIFLAVASMAWFSFEQLHRTSSKLVVDTLPGLMDAGMASERMCANRHAMRLMLAPANATNRLQMIAQVQANNTDKLWQDYETSIYENEDRQNFQKMMATRQDYLIACQQFYGLVTAGKMAEAATFFDGDLSARFHRYEDAVKVMFDYNVRQGTARGERFLKTERYAPAIMAGLAVFIFLLGLVLGMRFTLSGAVNPSISNHYSA